MDSYLDLAERILRNARQPLSSREILNRAYAQNLVSSNLHGKTQHKTIGARLSEDIILRRDRSLFFRTQPGKFFLRCFLDDPNIPEKYRVPMIARRRKRELLQGRAVAFNSFVLCPETLCADSKGSVYDLIRAQKFSHIADLSQRHANEIVLWSFVVVTKGAFALTYRHGRYREDRDAFLKRRSVGFFAPVTDEDYDLFHWAESAVIWSGLKAVMMDLDLPRPDHGDEYASRSTLQFFILPRARDVLAADLLAVVRFECPSWFEPLNRRLAINDLAWMDLSVPPNHEEDFDPWSRSVLERSRVSGRE